jgi:hypothetical protein
MVEALFVLAVVLVPLALVTLVHWDQIRENWRLWRLRKTDLGAYHAELDRMLEERARERRRGRR